MLTARFADLAAALQALTPMPDDDILNSFPEENNPMDTLDNIITELGREIQLEYPLEIIPPLLEAFGIGEGNGVFWSLLHLIEAYPDEQELYPLIQQATLSSYAGPRKWCCYLLARRRDREDEPIFIERFQDPVAEVRKYALKGIITLSQRYPMEHLIPLVEPLLRDEDKEVRNVAAKTVETLKTV